MVLLCQHIRILLRERRKNCSCFLAERLNPQLVPQGFVLACELALCDLQARRGWIHEPADSEQARRLPADDLRHAPYGHTEDSWGYLPGEVRGRSQNLH